LLVISSDSNTETSTAQSSKFQQRAVIVIEFNFASQILNRCKLAVGAAEHGGIYM